MIARIVEQRAIVVEVTYDVDVPEEIFREIEGAGGESVEDLRDDWIEVDRRTIRSNYEILSIERASA